VQYAASRHITPLYFPNINYYDIEYLFLASALRRRRGAVSAYFGTQVTSRLLTGASCMTPVPLVTVQLRPLFGSNTVTP
jgi:hypothetical protein